MVSERVLVPTAVPALLVAPVETWVQWPPVLPDMTVSVVLLGLAATLVGYGVQVVRGRGPGAV